MIFFKVVDFASKSLSFMSNKHNLPPFKIKSYNFLITQKQILHLGNTEIHYVKKLGQIAY